jgi:hypothetical protein
MLVLGGWLCFSLGLYGVIAVRGGRRKDCTCKRCR